MEHNDRRLPWLARLFAAQEGGLLLVVALLAGLLAFYGYYDAPVGKPNVFLSRDNLVDGIASPMSIYAIMAAGLTLVIISGGIDISVASIMVLSGFVTAYVVQQFDVHAKWYIVGPVSLLLPLAIGLACGLINGAIIVGLRIHPFIVTLGTQAIFRGICNVLPFGTKSLPSPGKYLPEKSLTAFFSHAWHGMRLGPLVATIVVIVLTHIYLRHMIGGREIYAVGGNEEAARFSGIRVGAVKLRVYAVSGLLAGLAGLVSLGRFTAMTTDSGNAYELTVIAAAVVGGASLIGGRGSALGALLGTLVLALIENGISVVRLHNEYRAIIIGLCIIAAVIVDRLGGDFQKRRLLRKQQRKLITS